MISTTFKYEENAQCLLVEGAQTCNRCSLNICCVPGTLLGTLDNKEKLASQFARIFLSGGEDTGIQTGWERRMLEISSIKAE